VEEQVLAPGLRLRERGPAQLVHSSRLATERAPRIRNRNVDDRLAAERPLQSSGRAMDRVPLGHSSRLDGATKFLVAGRPGWDVLSARRPRIVGGHRSLIAHGSPGRSARCQGAIRSSPRTNSHPRFRVEASDACHGPGSRPRGACTPPPPPRASWTKGTPTDRPSFSSRTRPPQRGRSLRAGRRERAGRDSSDGRTGR
jgi:hypothetical protein